MEGYAALCATRLRPLFLRLSWPIRRGYRVPNTVCWLLCICAAACAAAVADSADSTRTSINLEALSRLKGIDLDANPAVKNVVLKMLGQVRGTPQFVEI